MLCIGINSAAMQTRTLILERAGHTITQARDLRQIKAACERTSFAVAILGQSLNPSEKQRIADLVRTDCKSARLLELHEGISPEFPGADAHLQVNATEPHGLVDAVTALLAMPKKKRRPQASGC